MLPKKNRLNLKHQADRGSFKAILNTEALSIKYKDGLGLKGAVVVPKTTAKKAVDRNRIKRVLLEALKSSDLTGDFIFVVKKNISSKSKSEINELLKTIKKKF